MDATSDPTLKIGDVARATGLGVETVRFYERQGLIPEPPRTPSGYRAYDADAVRRLRFIRRAKALGFELREIGELLSLSCDDGATCADVRAKAEAKIAVVEARLAELAEIRDALAALAGRCHGAGPASTCPFLDRLEGVVGGEA